MKDAIIKGAVNIAVTGIAILLLILIKNKWINITIICIFLVLIILFNTDSLQSKQYKRYKKIPHIETELELNDNETNAESRQAGCTEGDLNYTYKYNFFIKSADDITKIENGEFRNKYNILGDFGHPQHNFVLMNDIDFGGKNIGNGKIKVLRGTFDGNCFKISNFNLDAIIVEKGNEGKCESFKSKEEEDVKYCGFFREINRGHLKNITFANFTVKYTLDRDVKLGLGIVGYVNSNVKQIHQDIVDKINDGILLKQSVETKNVCKPEEAGDENGLIKIYDSDKIARLENIVVFSTGPKGNEKAENRIRQGNTSAKNAKTCALGLLAGFVESAVVVNCDAHLVTNFTCDIPSAVFGTLLGVAQNIDLSLCSANIIESKIKLNKEALYSGLVGKIEDHSKNNINGILMLDCSMVYFINASLEGPSGDNTQYITYVNINSPVTIKNNKVYNYSYKLFPDKSTNEKSQSTFNNDKSTFNNIVFYEQVTNEEQKQPCINSKGEEVVKNRYYIYDFDKSKKEGFTSAGKFEADDPGMKNIITDMGNHPNAKNAIVHCREKTACNFCPYKDSQQCLNYKPNGLEKGASAEDCWFADKRYGLGRDCLGEYDYGKDRRYAEIWTTGQLLDAIKKINSGEFKNRILKLMDNIDCSKEQEDKNIWNIRNLKLGYIPSIKRLKGIEGKNIDGNSFILKNFYCENAFALVHWGKTRLLNVENFVIKGTTGKPGKYCGFYGENKGTIVRCSFNGSAYVASLNYSGLICGLNNGNIKSIKMNIENGEINAFKISNNKNKFTYSTGSKRNRGFAGGLVGKNQKNITLNYPISFDNVNINGITAGGIVACQSNKAKINIRVDALPAGTYSLKGGRRNKYCTDRGGKVVCNVGHIKKWQKFKLEPQNDGTYAIRGGKNNKYCTDRGGKVVCNVGHIKKWQKFKLKKQPDGTYAIQGGNPNNAGKYCGDFPRGIRCNIGHIRNWEKFKIEPINEDIISIKFTNSNIGNDAIGDILASNSKRKSKIFKMINGCGGLVGVNYGKIEGYNSKILFDSSSDISAFNLDDVNVSEKNLHWGVVNGYSGSKSMTRNLNVSYNNSDITHAIPNHNTTTTSDVFKNVRVTGNRVFQNTLNDPEITGKALKTSRWINRDIDASFVRYSKGDKGNKKAYIAHVKDGWKTKMGLVMLDGCVVTHVTGKNDSRWANPRNRSDKNIIKAWEEKKIIVRKGGTGKKEGVYTFGDFSVSYPNGPDETEITGSLLACSKGHGPRDVDAKFIRYPKGDNCDGKAYIAYKQFQKWTKMGLIMVNGCNAKHVTGKNDSRYKATKDVGKSNSDIINAWETGNKKTGVYTFGNLCVSGKCSTDGLVSYVKIQKTNKNFLTLMEVQVFDDKADNVALKSKGGVATQSSNQYSSHGHADKAINGNTDKSYSGGKNGTHTKKQKEAWWMVKLPEPTKVTKVKVYNRTDCCSARLNYTNIMLLDENKKEMAKKSWKINGPSVQEFKFTCI